MTELLSRLYKDSENKLSLKHPDTASFEVKTLIKHCFKLSDADFLLQLREPIHNNEARQQFNDCLERRLNNEPLDLIIGHSNFRGNDYDVEKGVLIPRPETELLVEHAIRLIQELPPKPLTIVECGFGTGIISIELAKTFPDAKIIAWDISEQATTLANKNKAKHDSHNIEFINDDFFDKNAKWRHFDNPFVFISNPPYIPSEDVEQLDDSVKHYDPKTALDGGPDGLDFYKRCFKDLKNKTQIQLYEIGIHQDQALKAIAEAQGYQVQRYADYHDIPRILALHSLLQDPITLA